MSKAVFPTGFVAEPLVINGDMVPGKYSLPFIRLQNAGFEVVANLPNDESEIAAITAIASQTGVREFCPKDLTQRWTDMSATRKQLAKDGGRGVVRLMTIEDHKTAGYGWVGASSAEEKAFLPDCENTFAERISEEFSGRGLGKLFARTIVTTAMGLWGARNIGLETWGSNTAAVRSYLGAGAILITTKDDKRPTLTRHGQEAKAKRHDTRLYMQYPWSA